MRHLIYFHLKAGFMQDTHHTAVIPNLLMLSCIIVDVIRCVVLLNARRSSWDQTCRTHKKALTLSTILCRIPAQCHVRASVVRHQKFRCESFSSSSLSVLQLISALRSKRRVLLQRRFNKSATFWWLCRSILCVCACVCVHFQMFLCVRLSISTLLSFSLCVHVRACFLDHLRHRQTAFKGGMKAVDINVDYFFLHVKKKVSSLVIRSASQPVCLMSSVSLE